MRVLMTGATKLQRHAPRDRNNTAHTVQKLDVPRAIANALVRLGHDVEWRPLTVGEDLRRWDAIWCSVSNFLSANASAGAGGMLWAHSDPEVPVVTFYDDWKATKQGHGHGRTILRRPAHFLGKAIVGPKDLRGVDLAATWHGPRGWLDAAPEVEKRREELRVLGEHSDQRIMSLKARPFFDDAELLIEHLDRIVAGCEAFTFGGRSHHARAVPMYAWGDPDSVTPHVQLKVDAPFHVIDPSHIVMEVKEAAGLDGAEAQPRRPAWALAALTKPEHLLEEFEDVTWPIDTIGHRSTGVRLDTEADVLRWSAERAGILSPPYLATRKLEPLKGWWRSRYLYGAITRTPVATARGEAVALGESYAYSARVIEQLTHDERRALAEAQATALRRHYVDRDGFDQLVQTALEAACS